MWNKPVKLKRIVDEASQFSLAVFVMVVSIGIDVSKHKHNLKRSIARPVYILFLKLEQLISSPHIAFVCTLRKNFSSTRQFATAHLMKLKALLRTIFQNRYRQDAALECLQNTLNYSTSSNLPAN